MNLVGLLTLLALGLALAWLIVTIHTIWMLTHPPRRSYAWAIARSLPGAPDELRLAERPAEHRIPFTQWTFRSRNLELPVWDLRGDRSDGPIIILTHGWGDSRITMLSSGRVEALLPLCSRLILWDLPGHGDAVGRCSLGERESTDLRGLVEHVSAPALGAQSQPSAPTTPPLILFGFSLGAITSLRAAAGNPLVSAVIAEAPYAAPWTPARNVLRLRGLPYRTNLPPAIALIGAWLGQGLRWWPRNNAAHRWLRADQVTQPTLILHGQLDAVSPIVDGETLSRQIPRATLITIPTGEHHNLWSSAAHRDSCAAAVTTIVASASSR